MAPEAVAAVVGAAEVEALPPELGADEGGDIVGAEAGGAEVAALLPEDELVVGLAPAEGAQATRTRLATMKRLEQVNQTFFLMAILSPYF